MTVLTIYLEGLSCGHCLNTVNRALAELAGVRVRTVRMDRVVVDYDSGVVTTPAIVAAVERAGYRAALAS
jgi:copper chaperone CopZ